jgi:hypothetical protein
MNKHCSKCKIEIFTTKRYCKECHASYMREWRKAHKVEKRPCTQCGDINVEVYHYDYSSPLEPVWLCRKHNEEVQAYLLKNRLT